jgi:hypothetical protein
MIRPDPVGMGRFFCFFSKNSNAHKILSYKWLIIDDDGTLRGGIGQAS